MSRLTTRIEDRVYYAKGKYNPTTLIAEMETWEIKECMQKLAEYEDRENDNKSYDDKIMEMIKNGNGLPPLQHANKNNRSGVRID